MKKILFTLLMMGAFLLPVPAQEKEYVILVHGGAGVMTALQDHPEQRDMYYAALDSALQIGERQMQLTGKGADVVLAVINYFESNPLFNSGIGATVSAAGQFELDACIMEGKDLNRLKVVLAEKKRTNKWLAEQIGVDQATVSKWCTNSAQPNLENLMEVAKCLEVDVKELLRM